MLISMQLGLQLADKGRIAFLFVLIILFQQRIGMSSRLPLYGF